jgi:hypothetical protein
MHKNATTCNETLSKWCKNKHGASKIIDTLETYHAMPMPALCLSLPELPPPPVILADPIYRSSMELVLSSL